MTFTLFGNTYIGFENTYLYTVYLILFMFLLGCMLISLGLAAWYDYKTLNIPLKVWIPMIVPLGYAIWYMYDNYIWAFGILAFVPVFIFIAVCGYLTKKKYIHSADLIGLTLCALILPPLMAFNITSSMTIPELAPYVLFAMTIFFMLPTRFYYWNWIDKRQTKFFSGYIPYFVPVFPAFIVTLFNPFGL